MSTTSILDSVKDALGGNLIDAEGYFDAELVAHINAVFFKLHQLGVGPDVPFEISSKVETWGDFLGSDRLALVKSYMFAMVRMMFDPPQSSVLVDVYKNNISEMEWRLNVVSDRWEGLYESASVDP